MSLESELHQCILADNVVEFNRILENTNTNILMPLLLEKLYTIALHGSIDIFVRVLGIPDVYSHLSKNVAARKSFLNTALGHSDLALVEQMLRLSHFISDVKEDPYSMVLAIATNRKCAPQALALIQGIVSVDELITHNNNQIWLTSYVNYNYLAMNRFLEFPQVFAIVIGMDPKQSQAQDYINTRFMEYYFSKIPTSDLNYTEAKLAFLILQALIKSYPDRAKIRYSVKLIAEREEDARRSNTFFYKATKSVRHLRERYLPDAVDIHAQRITQLLAKPAVNKLAQNTLMAQTVSEAANHILAAKSGRAKAVFN